jgi:hypothetical protein
MNSLPSQTTFRLIQELEAGKIDPNEAARRIAQIHTAKTESYAETLITGILLTGVAWVLTGGSLIIPAAIAFLTWDTYMGQRRERLERFKFIAQGKILDYLPDEERSLFETLLTETQTQKAVQPSYVSPGTARLVRRLAETQSTSAIQIADIAQVLIHPLKPLIISACPRVGKGIIASHALTLATQHHGAKVWVLQPKPHPSELGYWKQADRFLGLNLEDYPTDDPSVAEQMTQFVRDWRAQADRPIILLIDELVKIQAMQPKWYRNFLIPQCLVEGSSGETDRRFLWMMTQSPLVSDIGMSGGNRAVFQLLTLQKANTQEHLESVRKSLSTLSTLPAPEDYQRSPVGILAFHSAKCGWAAVPEYPVPTLIAGDSLCCDLKTFVAASLNPKRLSVSTDEDPEFRVWRWGWQKLTRFPDGKTARELWNDCPKSLTHLITREQFDGYLATAIEVGCLLDDGSGKLTHNPDLQP